MPLISVIVPTVDGREVHLDDCLYAYEQTTPDLDLIVIANKPACGQAWIEGAAKAKGDFLHFTADDLVPHAGWWEAAVSCVERGYMPAAWVLDPVNRLGCQVQVEDTMYENVLVPFLTRAQYEEGGWLLPIHYGTDDWITYKAIRAGIHVELCPEYRFTHNVAEAGRLYNNRRYDVPQLAEYMKEAGHVPQVYADVARYFNWRG